MATHEDEWQRSCDVLVHSLRTLDRKTATIRRSTNKLVALRDMARERERVRQTTSSVGATDVPAIHHELRLLERVMQHDASYNVEGVRLMNDAHTALHEYEAACDAFYQRCIAVDADARGRQQLPHSASSRGGDADEAQALLAHEADDEGGAAVAVPVSQAALFERDLYDELMAERERETREIAESVRDIHEIFVHINEMIGEQGVQLESVDANLATANRATRNATSHLHRAAQHQRTSPRNQLLLIFVLVLFLVVAFMLLLRA